MADIPVNASDAVVIVSVVTNGQVAYDFDFRADTIEDLKAIYNYANGTTLPLVGGTDFTASGLATEDGGTITLTSFTATVAGDKLSIYRDTVIERVADYQKDLFADDLNAELDRYTMILQEQSRDVSRAVKNKLGAPPIAAGQFFVSDGAGGAVAGGNAEDVNQAQAYAEAAGSSATQADASKTLASQWAQNPEDTAVPGTGGTGFSAFHWMRKSLAIYNALANTLAGWIHAATAKTLPDDADELGIADSAAAWALKKLTMLRLKAYIAKDGFTGAYRDKLINGAGEIDIRSYTTVADDVYWCDRHFVLTQTAPITPTRIADVATRLPFMMRLTQSQAAAQRMGNAQIIEASVSRRLQGKQVTLGGKLRCSSSQPIRFAILEWFGTGDAPVSDVVANWASGSYTAGGFFLGSNLGVVAVGSITPVANTITDWFVVGNISASNNIIVMMWTEGTAAQNVTLDMTWGLVGGDASGEVWPYEMRSPQQERSLCERYAEDGIVGWQGNTQSGGSYRAWFQYRTTKRATPSLSGSGQGETGFPSGVPTFSVVDGLRSFSASKVASVTGTPSNFTFYYLADCEL